MVTSLVKERRQFLVLLESGEQDDHSSMAQALDAWIKVLDDRQAIADEKTEAKGAIDAETAKSVAWRIAALAKWTDKKQLRLVAAQNLAKEAAVTDGDTLDDVFRPLTPNRVSSITPQPNPQHRKRGHQASELPAHDKQFVQDFSRLVDHYIGNVQPKVSTPVQPPPEVVTRLDNLELGVNKILALLEKG